MVWFDFTSGGAVTYVNSDVITCITDKDGKTEIAFASGGGVVVDQPISEVVGAMFEKIEEEADTYTAGHNEEQI